jgi:hypothetical protein
VLGFASLELAPLESGDPHLRERRAYYATLASTVTEACIAVGLEVRAWQSGSGAEKAGKRLRRTWGRALV